MLGSSNGDIFTSTTGGATFTTAVATLDLRDVSGVWSDGTIVVVIGSNGSAIAAIRRSLDRGATWSTVTARPATPANVRLSGITGSASELIIQYRDGPWFSWNAGASWVAGSPAHWIPVPFFSSPTQTTIPSVTATAAGSAVVFDGVGGAVTFGPP